MIKPLKYVVFTGISLLLITVVLLLKPSTPFSKDKEILYLPTGKTSRVYLDSLVRTQQWLNTFWLYTWWANQQHLGQFLRPGKYEIPKGSSIFSFVWRLKKNRQVPVKLVIPKIRTLEQLAGFLGKHLENDSAQFLHFLKEVDSLKVFAVDTSSVLTGIFPDTYEFYWTANSRQVFEKLFREKKKFWTPERLGEASRQQLTPDEVYILASIIEEETNA
ncbi:MAG: endolytic transglycosylase MltG, partial [Chitinophagaceae bacterium]